MRRCRVVGIAVFLNAMMWIAFWAWFSSSLRPVPHSATEYQDLVDYPVTEKFYLPRSTASNGVIFQVCKYAQFPASLIGRAILPRYSTAKFVFGFSVFVWRICLV